ncbi:MAG: ABC transporter ATP-binding protein [Pyrinomonadaceae bacterium]
MKPILQVERLCKQYTLGARDAAYDTLREFIVATVKAPLNKFRSNFKTKPETIWALDDVSFEVARGEVVGVVGRNGAGKSSLLKVLARITEPTSGRIALYGRVASLLEVGTGFHPELTGRENIYLNGAILGMRRAEISRNFDQIVAFAELEKFLDTAVKRYSSGMYMRLAFAVASHLQPEILLVDEVLAVGDAAFQKKCLGKMGDVAREGRTVLFVSHNMTAVRTLCRSAIWLDKGAIVAAGEASRVISNYMQSGAETTLERTWADPAAAPGNNIAKLQSITVTRLGQPAEEPITVKTAIQITCAFWNYQPGARLNFSFVLYNLEGVAIFNTGSEARSFPVGLVRGSFVIPGDFLNDGVYTIRLLVVKNGTEVCLDRHDLLTFEVQDAERTGTWYGKWIGVVRPKFEWELEAAEESSPPALATGHSAENERT